ncbi:hypothetical protein GCM10022393_34250 [Aquimarina addita]|uniref:DUF3857 domain-containing protein n=1 Tax=Aquimarina addita TaxID=870485 RepID=A0ABP6USM7_9FLAO
MYAVSIFAQKKEITIPFNPDTSTPYKYDLQSFTKIDEYNSQQITVEGSYEMAFKKSTTNFIATDTFSKLEIISGNKLIFSLNLMQEYYSRKRVLKDYFNTIPLTRKFDFKGTQTEGWDTSFILYYPEMGKSDKQKILKVVEQLDAPLRTFYIDRPMTVGDTFTNNDMMNAAQLNLASKSINIEAKLIEVKDDEALFIFKSTFFIPQRSRDKEIIDRKEAKAAGMLVVDINSGMPIKARMILEMGDEYAITTMNKKGMQKSNYKYWEFIRGQYGEIHSVSQPKKDQEQKSYEELTVATKEKALERLDSITPFLTIKSHTRGCGYISATTKQFTKGVRLYPRHIKGIIRDSTFFDQKIDVDKEPIYLYANDWSDHTEASIIYCDLPRDIKIKYDCELSMPYGIEQNKYLIDEYAGNTDEKLTTKIFDWKDNSISVKDQTYVEYYNDQKERIFPRSVQYDFLPTKSDTIYGIPKKDITPNQCFLLMNAFSSEKFNLSYIYNFKEKIAAITIYQPIGYATVARNYELSVKTND